MQKNTFIKCLFDPLAPVQRVTSKSETFRISKLVTFRMHNSLFPSLAIILIPDIIHLLKLCICKIQMYLKTILYLSSSMEED